MEPLYAAPLYCHVTISTAIISLAHNTNPLHTITNECRAQKRADHVTFPKNIETDPDIYVLYLQSQIGRFVQNPSNQLILQTRYNENRKIFIIFANTT